MPCLTKILTCLFLTATLAAPAQLIRFTTPKKSSADEPEGEITQ